MNLTTYGSGLMTSLKGCTHAPSRHITALLKNEVGYAVRLPQCDHDSINDVNRITTATTAKANILSVSIDPANWKCIQTKIKYAYVFSILHASAFI
jgi:hypothetical protein